MKRSERRLASKDSPGASQCQRKYTGNVSRRVHVHYKRTFRLALRKLAAHRKSLHGELVNDILRLGDIIKLEKLSYKALQKLFGKSVGKRALLYVRLPPKKQGPKSWWKGGRNSDVQHKAIADLPVWSGEKEKSL